MLIDEARPFARRLFAAHGRSATDAIVDEYASVLVEARCEPCAVIIIERARTTGRLSDDGSGTRRLPSAPELREAIGRMGASVAHGNHLGSSSKTEEASRLEAFWRSRASKLIRPAAGSTDLALFIAAQMWWSQVSPTLDDVASVLDTTGELWVDTARAFLHGYAMRGIETRVVIERAFERAREAHICGVENISAALVDLQVGA